MKARDLSLDPADDMTVAALPAEADWSFERSVWLPIKSRWRLVVAVPLFAMAFVLLWQAVSTPEFTARTVVAPSAQSSGDLSRQLGRLGGIASLAGGALDKGEVTEFDKFRFLLTSERLGQYQAEERDFLPVVFRDRYDAATGTWKPPGGFLAGMREALLPLFGMPGWLPPDGRDLARVYRDRLTASDVGETGLLQIRYVDEDPARALVVLEAIVEDANSLLRADAAARAEQKAAYLRRQLLEAQIAEYRTNLAGLLATEEQTLMLTATSLPFAATTVQPYTVSRRPTSQQPLLFALIGALTGLALGVLAALLMGPRPVDRRALPPAADPTDSAIHRSLR